MEAVEELLALARKLSSAWEPSERSEVSDGLKAVEKAVEQVKRSFSGSWMGYHAYVYYEGLRPTPPGANFSQEWGLIDTVGSLGSRGHWHQFDSEAVKKHIFKLAGDPDLTLPRDLSIAAARTYASVKSEILSILETEITDRGDPFLTKLKGEVEELEPLSKFEISQRWAPRGQIMTRDTLALGQGTKVPPHVDVRADVSSILNAFYCCKAGAEICTKAASHIERKDKKKRAAARIGTNVFIGHGRSSSWRELKDFIQDRLSLPWDEFNRIPVAGITNITRLSEMLDAAAIAFLVMTAEDEMVSGDLQARMNVVHEAGLFQGRLGFSRAIILLEEGCSEFSNVQGLGQIRFPKGNISASFEDIRRVLEREGLVKEL